MSSLEKLTDTDKLLKIREYKEKGNAEYKEGKFDQAARSYYKAILYIKGLSTNCADYLTLAGLVNGNTSSGQPLEKTPGEMTAETKNLVCDCYNNLAACMLKDPQPKYERIIEHCNQALAASPNNVKALFRKGTSLYALRDYEAALKTLQKASPDPTITKIIEQCKLGMKKQDQEMAARFKNMFKS